MDIVRDYEHVPQNLKNTVLAVGNFDGVHLGHQAVLAVAKEFAAQNARKVGVMVFDPHPREFFAPQTKLFRLTPLDLKLSLFRALDLDFAAVLPFTTELSALTAEQFVERVLLAGEARGRPELVSDAFAVAWGFSGYYVVGENPYANEPEDTEGNEVWGRILP